MPFKFTDIISFEVLLLRGMNYRFKNRIDYPDPKY